MKPTLQLRLGQSLTMTPQLQQAIRLLQLSTLELQQEIQQALDNNPLLEQEENEAHETSPIEPQDASQLDSSDAMAQDKMPDELPVDTTWDEVYSAGTAQSAGPIHDGEDSIYQGETTENLQDYLLWQMRLTPFSDLDAAIALAYQRVQAVGKRAEPIAQSGLLGGGAHIIPRSRLVAVLRGSVPADWLVRLEGP